MGTLECQVITDSRPPMPRFRRIRSGILAVVALLLYGLPVAGQEPEAGPLSTDRPTFSIGTGTVLPGRFQFELGYTYARSGETDEHGFGELLARLGIFDWLEGRVGLNSFVLLKDPTADLDGLEDLTIGFKARAYRSRDGSPWAVPNVSILVGADLPTGATGIGAGETVPFATLATDWDLSHRVLMTSNLGWAYGSSDGERFHQGQASLALGYSFSRALSGFVEWYGLFPENRGGGANHYLNWGVVWLLGPNLQLDGRVGAGLQEPDPNWFTGVGLSLRL